MNTKIESKSAPAVIGPFSQAIDTGDFVFVSGQLPIDKDTGELAGDDIQTQTKKCLDNMKAILEAAGLTMKNVCKARVLLTDMNEFAAMNAVYAEYFEEPYPARAAVGVVSLAKGAKVEIEAIASK